jgi:UDP-glucose 4-epimerase
MGQKVLVTGGAGFIGSHIVDRLLAAGCTVEVVDNLSSGKIENLPEKDVKLHQVDIRSPECAKIVADFTPKVVVHAAAQMSVRHSMDDPRFDADVNVVGLVNILSSLRARSDVPRCVFLSTGGAIYGEQVLFPAPESHPVRPESVYGLSKWVGEQYLDFWSRTWGVTSSVLRLANVYGPRQNPHGEAGVVAIFSRGLISGKPLVINGTGKQTRDFVYVQDVARAVEICVTNNHPGIFNIGTGVETDVNTLVAAMRKALDAEGNVSHGPAKGGEQMRSCIDPSAARQIMGWTPEMNLDQGIKLTAEWFRANK